MLLSPYCNARHYFLRVAFYQESFSHFKKDPAFLQDPHSQSYFSSGQNSRSSAYSSMHDQRTGTIWRFFPVIRIIKFPEGIRTVVDHFAPIAFHLFQCKLFLITADKRINIMVIHIWRYHADPRIHFHYMMNQFTVCLFVKDTGQDHPDLGCPGSLTVRTAYEHSKASSQNSFTAASFSMACFSSSQLISSCLSRIFAFLITADKAHQYSESIMELPCGSCSDESQFVSLSKTSSRSGLPRKPDDPGPTISPELHRMPSSLPAS